MRHHPNEVLKLSQYERKEVLKFSEVYYLGSSESKEQRNFKNILTSRSNSLSQNHGFDRNGGLYKVIPGDHIAYRYEIIKELDRGAFGQVIRCIDHKSGQEVAVKINKSMPSQHNNTCRAEAAIMQRIRDTVCDEGLSFYKRHIVEYVDHFLFRNHYVSINSNSIL